MVVWGGVCFPEELDNHLLGFDVVDLVRSQQWLSHQRTSGDQQSPSYEWNQEVVYRKQARSKARKLIN